MKTNSKKKFTLSITIFALVTATSFLTGCSSGSVPESPVKEESVKEEAVKEEAVKEEPDKEEAIKEEPVEQDPVKEEPIKEEAVKEEPTKEEEPATFDTPEEVLDMYLKSPDKDVLGYMMFDVDADGKEEMFITERNRVTYVYGNYNGKLQRIISLPKELDLVIYPKGMAKAVGNEMSESGETIWLQYYTELGDFLSVFQESDGEYYTFCAYDLSEDEMKEVKQSLEDTGYYPAWLGEWADQISKEQYDKLVPKTEPVKLPDPDALSDRSALETKSEYFDYVNAPDGYANLRTGPGTGYDVICRIPNGRELEVYLKDATTENGKRWLKVAYYIETDSEPGYAWLTGWIAESQLE